MNRDAGFSLVLTAPKFLILQFVVEHDFGLHSAGN